MQVNLAAKSIVTAFLICLFLTLIAPSVTSAAPLLFFSPFLIMTLYQKPLIYCLWLAILCGAILDLLASSPHLGIRSAAFCAALICLYPQQRHFFADNLSTLPLMTFFFSSLSTICYAAIVYLVEMVRIFSIEWFISDLILLPIADALFGFTFFIVPALLFGKRRLHPNDYFLENR